MKMRHLTTTLLCAGSLLAIQAVAGDDSTTTQPGSATGRDHPSMNTPGSSTMSQGSEFRASKAIGAEVKSNTGDKLGKVDDLLFNQQGRVSFAVISYEGKLYPVPWSLLTGSMTERRGGILSPTGQELSFTAQFDKTKLQGGPTIDRSRWSELTQPGFDQRVYTHYGVSQSGMGAPGTESGIGTGSDLNKDSNKDLHKDTTPSTPDTTPAPTTPDTTPAPSTPDTK